MIRKNVFYLVLLLLFGAQTLHAQLETCRLVITDGIRNETLKKAIEKNVSDFLTACNAAVIKDKKPVLDKTGVTGDGRKRFLEIWAGSSVSCTVSTLDRNCLIRPAGGYQIRDIPVTLHDALEDGQNQEIIINLTSDGRIDDIFVPITQYTDLLSEQNIIEDINLRLTVLDFIENFRTAYNRKDLSFIETVFSENAVIIVGKEVKQKPNTDRALRTSLSTAQFEYQVKNKLQYISSLKNVFKMNKYVSVLFDDIEVICHPNPKYRVYGVTLKQNWRSGNNTASDYMDIGYVFLLIDFEDPDKPVITVRTWQPEKYEGRNLRRDEIFKLGHFIK